MHALIFVAILMPLVCSKPCDTQFSDHAELVLSLNKKLLRSSEEVTGRHNPSVHLALRLSDSHNLGKESQHLTNLKSTLHNDIQNSLSGGQSVVGLLALYTLALKASCHDLDSVSFTVDQLRESLLTHLKRQMEQEKEHIAINHRPLTNYYQYSLGVLALCVSGIRVNVHVSNKLIKAVEHGHLRHGETESVDTLAMAGMALQCVKDSPLHGLNSASLDTALTSIKQKLLASQRGDGHMGNEFSTGLAVQALLAMGRRIGECAAPLEALRTDVRRGTYHNPMAISQVLPALQQKSYLHVKTKECLNEDDTLVLEPEKPVDVLPSLLHVALEVVVVKSNGGTFPYSLNVPQGSSLLKALENLREENIGFTFDTESSLYGPFLSIVNGEQARQSDRRYWHLSSNGDALTEGINDFKIEADQTITIKNTSY